MDDLDHYPSLDSLDAVTEAQTSFGTAEEVIEKHTKCGLCGSHLHFSHVTDFSRNLTLETAKCPECGVKTRRVYHKLQ